MTRPLAAEICPYKKGEVGGGGGGGDGEEYFVFSAGALACLTG